MTRQPEKNLWERVFSAKQRLPPWQSKYRIVWEAPSEIDAPARITAPDPHWMGAAVAGDVLPDVTAYARDLLRITVQFPGEPEAAFHVSGINAHRFRTGCVRFGGKVLSEIIVSCESSYADPIGPMTEEQAIEYLVQKDIPAEVWGGGGNRDHFKIVNADQVPTDRRHRNAWELVA